MRAPLSTSVMLQWCLHGITAGLTSPLESAASTPLQSDKLHQRCVWFASYMSVFCQMRALFFLYVRHKSDFTYVLFFLSKLVGGISFLEFLLNHFNFCDCALRNVSSVMWKIICSLKEGEEDRSHFLKRTH